MSVSATKRLPLFGAFGLGGLVSLVLVVAIVRGPVATSGPVDRTTNTELSPSSSEFAVAPDHPVSTPSGEAPPAQPMTTAELDAASTVEALEALTQKYPTEPRAWRKLAMIYDLKTSGELALRAVRRTLELDPKTATDKQLQRIVSTEASSATPTTADMAFETMTSMMGSAGPDLMFEIAGSTASGAKRASDALHTDANLRTIGTPALRIALDLRFHSGCDRKPFIAIAERDGDERSLGYLSQLLPPTKCGPFKLATCADCFGDRSDIQKAIAAIKQRASAPH